MPGCGDYSSDWPESPAQSVLFAGEAATIRAVLGAGLPEADLDAVLSRCGVSAPHLQAAAPTQSIPPAPHTSRPPPQPNPFLPRHLRFPLRSSARPAHGATARVLRRRCCLCPAPPCADSAWYHRRSLWRLLSPGRLRLAPPSLMRHRRIPPELCAVYMKKGISELYPWQVECLLVEGVLEKHNLVYCASTSAGKSFVAEVQMLRRILSSGKMAVLVLPYVSICAEKADHILSNFVSH